MITLFGVLLLNALMILGLHYTLQYDEVDGEVFNEQILWRIKYYAVKYLGDYWSKPFGGCLICMSALWSVPVYFYFFDSLYLYPIYILALAGLNRLLIRLI